MLTTPKAAAAAEARTRLINAVAESRARLATSQRVYYRALCVVAVAALRKIHTAAAAAVIKVSRIFPDSDLQA